MFTPKVNVKEGIKFEMVIPHVALGSFMGKVYMVTNDQIWVVKMWSLSQWIFLYVVHQHVNNERGLEDLLTKLFDESYSEPTLSIGVRSKI